MRFAILLCAALGAHAQTSMVIGWISDHGVCVPQGTSVTTGPRTTDCLRQRQTQAMVDSWNPDIIVSTGDMSNVRGNRAETYKGILVRTSSAVTAPGSFTSTLQEAVTGAVGSQTIEVSALTNVGAYAVNFDGANAEVITVTARSTTPPYTITAEFLRSHSVGEQVATNSQTINVDTTGGLSCDGADCYSDLFLTGRDATFTIGTNLTNIIGSGGLCTATFTNTDRPFKANDQVTISGEAALDGTFTATSGAATTLAWNCDATGTYTTVGMSITIRRLIYTATILGIGEETFAQYEMAAVTAATPTSFTATFAKSHASGAIVRGSDHVTILHYAQAGRFHPTSGNHDYGGGDSDWCTSCISGGFGAFTEYWESVAGGSWTDLNGTMYHRRGYGTNGAGDLITFYSTATSGMIGTGAGGGAKEGETQELYFTPLMNTDTSKWKVTLTHYPLRTDNSNSALYLTGSDATLQQYLWMANPNVDIVLSGHSHMPDHVTGDNDAGAEINFLVMGAAGDTPANNSATNIDGGQCASLACTVVWGGTTAGGNATLSGSNFLYQAGKITVSDTELKIEYFAYNDWDTPVHTVTLNKAATGATDPCAGTTRVCFSGGISIQ